MDHDEFEDFVSDTIDYRLYNELGTRAGGEDVEFP